MKMDLILTNFQFFSKYFIAFRHQKSILRKRMTKMGKETKNWIQEKKRKKKGKKKKKEKEKKEKKIKNEKKERKDKKDKKIKRLKR